MNDKQRAPRLAISFLPPRYRPYFWPVTISVLLIVLIVLVGYTLIRNYFDERNSQVSELLYQLSFNIEEGNATLLEGIYEEFESAASGEQLPYGAMAYGKWLFEQKNYGEAIRVYQKVVADADDVIARDLARLAMINVAFEVNDDGSNIQRLALEYESQDLYARMALNSLLGDVYAARGEYEDAISYYSDALSFAENIGDRNLSSAVRYKVGAMFSARIRKGVPSADEDAAPAAEPGQPALELPLLPPVGSEQPDPVE